MSRLGSVSKLYFDSGWHLEALRFWSRGGYNSQASSTEQLFDWGHTRTVILHPGMPAQKGKVDAIRLLGPGSAAFRNTGGVLAGPSVTTDQVPGFKQEPGGEGSAGSPSEPDLKLQADGQPRKKPRLAAHSISWTELSDAR